MSNAEVPTVTMIVPANNEAAVIEAKITNLGELQYPRGKFNVVVALDGCTDLTKPLAQAAISQCGNRLVAQTVEYASNIGKVAVLNAQIEAASSELVAVSDASASIGFDSLVKAAQRFNDPSVGIVCGTYRIVDRIGCAGEGAYWRYQTQIKIDESQLAAPMGAHGSFYVFRRSLWTPMPADTINDDFVLPMTIVLRGFRAIYDPSIVATELDRSDLEQEFRRRIRIGAGNLQQALRLATLGDPRRGWVSFVFLSGKGLRAVLPFLFFAAFLSSVTLSLGGNGLYQCILLGEIGVLTFVAAVSFGAAAVMPKPLASLCYLVQGHAAAALGALLLLIGGKHQAWKISRTAEKVNTGAQK
jgi:cellulose synthase/poly-beta-1,6-N-acetylglucosamine synthase-like glycosyltransferase